MAKLSNSIESGAPVETVWEMIGDAARAPEWLPGIATARIEGNERFCETADGQPIHEELEISETDRTLKYVQFVVPFPVHGSKGTMRVSGASDRAIVLWDAEFEPNDPATGSDVAEMVDGYYKQTLDNLKRVIEASA